MKSKSWMTGAGVVCAAALLVVLAPGHETLAGRQDPVVEVQAEPSEVVVQHVLVSFRGAVGFGRRLPPRALRRSASNASSLADRLLLAAHNQEPFARLVRQHSDDWAPGSEKAEGVPCADGCGPTGEAPGAYRLVLGVASSPREGLAAMLHDTLLEVGRTIEPGEIRLVPYHPEHAPLGHHLVRRLR